MRNGEERFPNGPQTWIAAAHHERQHVYVGHMFSDGVTILDARDPRKLTPVGFFTAGTNTRTHHLQVSDDLLLLANGANIVAMQSYDNMRGYFENALVDIASWVPPTPKKLIDPRPNVSLAAKSADIFVRKDGLMFVSDWNAGLNILQFEG